MENERERIKSWRWLLGPIISDIWGFEKLPLRPGEATCTPPPTAAGNARKGQRSYIAKGFSTGEWTSPTDIQIRPAGLFAWPETPRDGLLHAEQRHRWVYMMRVPVGKPNTPVCLELSWFRHWQPRVLCGPPTTIRSPQRASFFPNVLNLLPAKLEMMIRFMSEGC